MIDATWLKAHRTATGPRSKKGADNQRGSLIGRTKRGMNTKLHAVTDSETRPVRLLRMHPRTNALLGPVPKWLDFMSGMLKIHIDRKPAPRAVFA